MLGMTWEATLNGALDEINRHSKDKADALDLITRLVREHPELEDHPLILEARLCLL